MKQKIEQYLSNVIGDFDQEEINNIVEILDGYDENLTNLILMDSIIINRLIDDEELINEIEQCVKHVSNSNPFD